MLGAKNLQGNLHSAAPFSRIRFVLFGFNHSYHEQVKSKLVSVGAVDVGEYRPDCTHVIVHNTVHDDPICVTARKDGKALVTSLWVDHSLDTGGPVHATSVMYRPPRDLSGIPGAKELFMCLTGYQRHEREDIMVMVGLMGAQFSKPLVANKVTHLICYKFEGEKYDLAKRMKKIKLVNRCWLEDCLKTWKVLSEERYSKSDYELEMMGAEARDSDDETGDIAGNYTEGRSVDTKNEMLGAHQHYETSSKASSSPTQKGLPSSVSATNLIIPIKEEKNLNQASTSKELNQIDERLAVHQGEYPMNSKSDVHEQSTSFRSHDRIGNDQSAKTSGNSTAEEFSSLTSSRKTPARKSSVPLLGGDNMGNLSDGGSKRFTGSNTGKRIPSNAKRSSGSSLSLQTAGEVSNSDVIMEENLAKKGVNISITNLESDKEKGASACVGIQSSKQPCGSNSGKSSPSSSSKTPRRSSSSLQTVDKPLDRERNLGNVIAEKSIDIFISNKEQGKGDVVSACVGASSIGNNLLDEEGSGILLPQKRKVECQSQRLASSASKRIDATEPKSSESSPFVKTKNDVFAFGSDIGDNPVKSLSGHKSKAFVKSNAKKAFDSRSLASEMLQSSKSMNIDATTCSITGSGAMSTALCAGNNKKAEAENEQVKVSSPCTKDSEVSKSASAKINSDDQIGNSIPKSSRKKTVARKTLGTRAKTSKKSAATRKDSVTENSVEDNAAVQDDAAICPTRQTDEGHAKSLHKRYDAINEGTKLLDNETETPNDLDLQNGNFMTVKSSNVAEAITKEGSSVLLGQTDEAVLTTSTGDAKEKSVKRRKGLSGRSKKKADFGEEGKYCDGNEAERGKTGEKAVIEKEQVECATGDNTSGTLLMETSKGPVEVTKETEAVIINVQGTSKSGKQTKKLGGRKRRGTLILNMPEDEVEREDHTGELAAKSYLINGPVEMEKESIPVVGNNQGTSKSGKLGKKLTGKKSKGHVEDGKENEIVVDNAESRDNSEKHAKKLAGNSKKKARNNDEIGVDKDPTDTRSVLCTIKHEPARFLVSGHRLQRKEFQQMIKRLGGRVCRDSHQWSYQATHLIVPDPL